MSNPGITKPVHAICNLLDSSNKVSKIAVIATTALTSARAGVEKWTTGLTYPTAKAPVRVEKFALAGLQLENMYRAVSFLPVFLHVNLSVSEGQGTIDPL